MELFAVLLNAILRKNGFVEQDMQMDFFLCCCLSLLDSSSLDLMNVSPQTEAFVLILGSEYRDLESSWPTTAEKLCWRGEVVYWEL